MLYSLTTAASSAELEARLTDLIYGSLLDQAHWQTFVSAIRDLYPNGHGTLFFHDKIKNRGMYAITAGIDHDWAADYQRRFSALNPWMENIAKRPIGLGAPAEHTVPRPELVKTGFYGDYLKPQEVITGVGMTVTEENGRLMALSVVGADVHDNDLRALSDLFTRLGPHMRRVIDLHRREGTDPLASARPLIDGLDIGIAVIDRHRRVLHASRRAQALLTSGRGIRLDVLQRLVIASGGAMDALAEFLGEDWRYRSTPKTASFHLEDRDRIPYRVTLIGGGRDAIASYFDGPRAFLIIEDLDRPLRVNPGLLKALYGLSSTEAKLLISLAKGMTLAQAATAREVSRETVRTQLKNACRKLGVSRQTDAVRLICRLGYSIAAPDDFQ